MIEIPNPLSPYYVDSFAYYTFRDRLPVILVKIVDSLYRNKKLIIDTIGEDKTECIKYITSELSRLRHELSTDKPITTFDHRIFGDEQLWNEAISEEKKRLNQCINLDGDISWFKCSFLFGECYMYRRIFDAVLISGLRDLDPFYYEKYDLLQRAINVQRFLTEFLHRISPTLNSCNKSDLLNYFELFLKMSLWGNEADLSLSIADDKAKMKLDCPQSIVEANNNKLLIDDFRDIFEFLFTNSRSEPQQETILSIFLDNAGSELLADLHLVEFLLSSSLASRIDLFCKSMPWYVSDVTEHDFQQTVTLLNESEDQLNQWLGRRIHFHINDDHRLLIRSHNFLSLPHSFYKMKSIFPELYHELGQSTLLIFKGDLNYRKLVSDLQWPITESIFHDCLLGFNPAPIVALRVLKCNVQVALTPETFTRATSECPDDWMICSRFGVIQSCFKR